MPKETKAAQFIELKDFIIEKTTNNKLLVLKKEAPGFKLSIEECGDSIEQIYDELSKMDNSNPLVREFLSIIYNTAMTTPCPVTISLIVTYYNFVFKFFPWTDEWKWGINSQFQYNRALPPYQFSNIVITDNEFHSLRYLDIGVLRAVRDYFVRISRAGFDNNIIGFTQQIEEAINKK